MLPLKFSASLLFQELGSNRKESGSSLQQVVKEVKLQGLFPLE